MHLSEIIAVRSVPGAGVFFALTRRCPLSCAHCSTNSMLSSEQHSETPFRRLAATFTAEHHPEILYLTGGEPLLRPRLVADLVERAHEVGTKVVLITGMYFARADGRVPKPLWKCLTMVDHVTASQDVHHEAQVPRRNAFTVLRRLRDAGRDVSFQLAGSGPQDPYLAEITAQIDRDFDGQVPSLVLKFAAIGRGEQLYEQPAGLSEDTASPSPCEVASWPVVAFDGSISACCNQEVIDGATPAHLSLGHARDLRWAEIVERTGQDPTLRALRVYGPRNALAQIGRKPGCPGVCDTCIAFEDQPGLAAEFDGLTRRPAFVPTESLVRLMLRDEGPLAFARRSGIRRYAHLVERGLTPTGAAGVEHAGTEPARAGTAGAEPVAAGRIGAARIGAEHGGVAHAND
ncbi:hypothetical protein GCM10009760_14940 [Kitasatospora kazusensis]|uniref:Radical SAM protein n=1 Tax=Kitasatospora kazusensis TaxID=407974 RepID=A0ABP5KV57_9ACTN